MRLVVVSNRLPFTVSFEHGAPKFNASSDGLSTGLASCLRQSTAGASSNPDYFWLGWPGASIPPEQEAAVRTFAEQHFKCCPVFLPEEKVWSGFTTVFATRLSGRSSIISSR
ncbi:MAG TPA: hypothetical protein VMA35_11775 [Candidatus Sulfopaludibacter sp.]|nr:hypothetical protein [Candidatus Sulfopaludibacter sp.]